MKKGKYILFIILGILVVFMAVILVLIYFEKGNRTIHYQDVSEDGMFSTTFIRESHSNMKQENYMISPYSVEIALSMLREGSAGETRQELDEVVPERKIKTLIVKDKVNVANAMFVKDIYKQDVKDSYYETLQNEYNADIVYDPFERPDKINNWVKKETNGMIKKILDQMDPQFVLGIANAVAMEEEWQTPFMCESTSGYAFTKADGKQYDVSMMSQSFEEGASYYTSEEADAVILPYKTYDRETGKEAEVGEQLDFIGILPKDLDSYISTFTMDTLHTIVEEQQPASSSSLEIYVGLPRFEYSYDFSKFKETLMHMGIQKVFTAGSCDLSNMLDHHPDAYVNEAIHKSYVKVNETGTKAAAVTYFGIKDMAMPLEDDKKFVSVIFDKPFIYLIKDHTTNEILFFGVVYEPEKWDENQTCE